MKIFLIITTLLILSSCSLMIDKTAKYSAINGQTRDQIISELGQPVQTDDQGNGEIIDTYIVEGRVYSSSEQHGKSMSYVMTLGLIEFIYFPISVWDTISEASCPTQKKLIIKYINDKCYWQTTTKIESNTSQ